MEAGVSVIVCCYNSATRIGETLRHLALQKVPSALSWEIVLVDNASTDSTHEIAIKAWEALGRKEIKLRTVHQPQKGLSFARATGIDTAHYDILLFCDDDNWLDPEYLYAGYDLMKNNDTIGALGGTGIAVAEIELPDWFQQYKYSYACHPQGAADGELREPTASLYGAGLMVRRQALNTLYARHFRPLLTGRIGARLASGDDTELCYALRLAGYRLWFSDRLKFRHFMPPSRLSLQYLGKLNEALAYSRSNLMVYQYALTGKPADGTTWIKDMAYQVIYFFESLLKFFFSSKSRFEKRLALSFSYNSLKGVWGQRGQYKRRYNELLRLKLPVT